MTEWTEEDSSTYREIAQIAVPRREEIAATVLSLIPFEPDEAPRVVELGCGEGMLAEAVLDRFPRASVLALDGSTSMQDRTRLRTARFGDRIRVRGFELAALDWWDLMHGADVVLASLSLHHLNDAKKQYLYKAIADRLSPRGALLIADLVARTHPAARRQSADSWDRAAREQAEAAGRPERFTQFLDAKWNHFRHPDPMDRPAAMLHHLVWLTHAGFDAADCFWMFAGHAVFGGFKRAERETAASTPPLRAGN